MQLHYLGIAALAGRLGSGGTSSLEATQAMLARIERLDGKLNSYVCVTGERALEQARRADEEIARGFSRGPLHGVPIAVKDVIDTDFAPTTVGLSFRAEHVPPESATVIRRLEAAGAVMLGKLASAEGIFVGHHARYGTPVNPRDEHAWAGASSSGSGVATAAGLCFGSLGTDTGGSIRVPASIHGLTGLKPSWGRVSRHGLFPLSPTLDHIGPIARSAEDAGILLQAIAGFDSHDPSSAPVPVPDYRALLGGSVAGLRIGVDREFATGSVDSEIAAAFDEALAQLAALGAQVVEVSMPATAAMLAAWAPICAAETAVAHEGTYPERAAEYGPELTTLLELGRNLSGIDVARALAARQEFAGRFALLMSSIDALAMPTLPRLVPSVEAIMTALREGSTEMGRFTIPPDMTGHPALTLPMADDPAGHPIGLQLVGRMWDEGALLRIGHAYQRVTGWHARHPELG